MIDKQTRPWCWWFVDRHSLHALTSNNGACDNYTHLADENGFDPFGKQRGWRALRDCIGQQTDMYHAVVLGPTLSSISDITSDLAFRSSSEDDQNITHISKSKVFRNKPDRKFWVSIYWSTDVDNLTDCSLVLDGQLFVIPQAIPDAVSGAQLLISAGAWLHKGMANVLKNTNTLVETNNRTGWICHWHEYVFLGNTCFDIHGARGISTSIRQIPQSSNLWTMTFGNTFAQSKHWYFGLQPLHALASKFADDSTCYRLDCHSICATWQNAIIT